jgi:solute carrier family 45 protein 1/2/4
MSLGTLWSISIIFYFICISSSIISSQLRFWVVSLVGMSWFVTTWIPFTLIGEYIRYHERLYLLDDDVEDEEDEFVTMDETPLGAGTILGLHNIFICIPQFLSSLLSSVIFLYFPSDPFGWALRVGALFSLFGLMFSCGKLTSPRKL